MKNDENGSIEIETSTDTVEQVQAALGEGVEIEDSQPVAEDKKAKVAAEETETPQGEETEESAETEEAAEAEKESAKAATAPKGKKPTVVPIARLDQEIARRKTAEANLAKAKTAREPEPEKEEPVDQTPQNFSGQPEPQLSDFTQGVDDLDPKAMAEATAKYVQKHHQWSRGETAAEAAYQAEQRRITEERTAHLKPFREAEKAVVTRHPDYHDRVKGSDVQISGYMESFVYRSKIGPDILLHFIDNPDDAARVMALDIPEQSEAMLELQKTIKAEIAGTSEEEITEELPKKTVPPKKQPSAASKAPIPPARLKSGGPQPKTMEELAGPADRAGVDIDFNPEYEKAVTAGRR